MPIVTETKTFYLTGYNADLSTVASASDIDNFIGKPSSNWSHGRFGAVTGSRAYTYVYLTFDLSSIPQGATITSLDSAKIKIARSTSESAYFGYNSVKGYRLDPETNDLITVGYSVTFTNSTSAVNLDITAAQFQKVLDTGNQFLIMA